MVTDDSSTSAGVAVGGDGCGAVVTGGGLVGSGVRVGSGVLTGVEVGVGDGVCVGSVVAVAVAVGGGVAVFVGGWVAVGTGVSLGLGVSVGGSGMSVGSASLASVMVVVGASEVQAIKFTVRPSNSNIEKYFVNCFIGFLP